MEHAQGRALFTTLVASARAACGAIADTAATSLYFGCEPGAAGADALAEDLACAVRTDAPGPLLVYQPSRSGHDTLVGKAVKGLFFEVVFNDPDRARGAPDAPLVVYAADEFHRFATTDWATGDPAFVDACRTRSRTAGGAICRIALGSRSCGTTRAANSYSDRPILAPPIGSTTSARWASRRRARSR